MSSIKKVVPTNTAMLKHVHDIISSLDGEEYTDLSFDKFLECRDNVFIALYRYDPHCIPIISDIAGIIACRRTNLKETEIPKLPYYCQPHRIIYSIECFHIFDTFKFYDDDMYRVIAKLLLETCSKDKNDAFISVKISNDNLKDYIREELIAQGYYQEFCDNDIYTFIKRPTVQTGRSN